MNDRLRSFLKKASHYFLGNGLAILSGLISYPILTRVLDPSEYGTMGLISSVLLVSVAAGKLGIQNSIIRFHAEAKKEGRLAKLASTYMTAGLLMGGAAAALQAAAALGFGAAGWIEGTFAGLVLLTAPLVLLRVQHSFGMSFLRAEERTRLYNVIDVVARYLSLALALSLVFWFVGGVRGFFVGILLAELIMATVVVFLTHRVTGFKPSKPQSKVIRQALGFGLPLLAFEVTSIVLAFGDRVLIKALASDVALGHYTAAYNLGDTLQKFMVMPIALAIQPMYMRLWSEEGAEATASFLSRAGAVFFLLAIPSIAGVTAVREPLILLLAGQEYLEGASVLPLTFGGFMLYGGYTVSAAGLFLKKETHRMAGVVGGACVLNVVLNVALIPSWGIVGAAVATLASYGVAIVALTVLAFERLRFDIPGAYLARVTVMSVVMWASVFWIETGAVWSTLLVRVLVGALVMGVLALGVDRQGRRMLLQVLNQQRRQ